jgi:hypothetical protein
VSRGRHARKGRMIRRREAIYVALVVLILVSLGTIWIYDFTFGVIWLASFAVVTMIGFITVGVGSREP